jgi:hypothetical protein
VGLATLLAPAVVAGRAPAAQAAAPAIGAQAAASAIGAQAAEPAIGAQWHATWASETDASRARELDTLAAHRVQWVRLDVGWPMIQPRRGSFDTAWGVPFVEQLIDAARAKGMKVLVTFWQTPSWANGGKGLVVPPDNPQDYANALSFLVKRWGGKVDAWQVWSEPNTADFMNPPDARRYVPLLQAAYRAAKAADPAEPIVFGGTMYVDTDWITKAYDAGAKGYFDIMAVHAYQGQADGPPEAADTGDRWNMTHVDALVQLMRSRGDGSKPIFFTEFGWSVHGNPPGIPVWERGVTEAQQADYLRRSVQLVQQRWPQVTAMFWYNSRDKRTGSAHQDGFGLMRRDFSPKPVLGAIKSLAGASSAAGALIPTGSQWRFRDDGVDAGTGWRARSFDDSTWRSGTARLGYGDAGNATTVAANRTGYAFRRSFDVQNPAALAGLKLRILRDDGVVVWLNGAEVWRDNMPSGSVRMTTPAASYVAGDAETTWRSVNLSPAGLVTGRNVLAVSVHNEAPASSDIRFDLELSGTPK